MEDLRTGYYERRKESNKLQGYDQYGNAIYGLNGYSRSSQKEDESLEEKFALYKLQNIIAVVAVVLLIVMDIFHIHVGGIGTDEIFTELSYSFTVQELFQQLVQLPQHLFSSQVP